MKIKETLADKYIAEMSARTGNGYASDMREAFLAGYEAREQVAEEAYRRTLGLDKQTEKTNR